MPRPPIHPFLLRMLLVVVVLPALRAVHVVSPPRILPRRRRLHFPPLPRFTVAVLDGPLVHLLQFGFFFVERPIRFAVPQVPRVAVTGRSRAGVCAARPRRLVVQSRQLAALWETHLAEVEDAPGMVV